MVCLNSEGQEAILLPKENRCRKGPGLLSAPAFPLIAPNGHRDAREKVVL